MYLSTFDRLDHCRYVKKDSHVQASSTFGDTFMIPVSHSRPSLIKKASKLSFTLNRDKGKEKDHAVGNNKDKDRDMGGRPSGATTLTTPSSHLSLFINVASNHTEVVVISQVKETTPTWVNGPSASPRLRILSAPHLLQQHQTKVLPPIPCDFAPRTTSPLPYRSPSPCLPEKWIGLYLKVWVIIV